MKNKFLLVLLALTIFLGGCGGSNNEPSNKLIDDGISDSETPELPDPTPDPTPEPTPDPTPDPIPEPTPDPTPEPTPDPTPE
ncbi:hypothetical protein, partial [Colwellia sp. E2M01]|uniref:hypothetical protein n=1 Tax=Colwellia sp. E2M01 TaxID=2841561 RepID=UPI001C08E26C